MVYSAHLYTRLALKPELGACLRTLLEMQRRNPDADPMALADVSRQALQFYRTNAPAYIRTHGYPDEIRAAYLDALRHIPAHINFVPANLTLLNYAMLGPADYPTNRAIADVITSLVNSGNQRLFASENEALERQTLADDCVARAQGNAAFASAMDRLLYPETGARLASATAAVLFRSRLLPADGESAKKRAQIQKGISAAAQIGVGTAALIAGNPAGIKPVLAGGFDLFKMFSGGQSAQDVIIYQLKIFQTSINDLSQNVDYRFGRVDRSLTTIYDTLNTQFDKIEFCFDTQGREIAILDGNVDAIRSTLVDVHSSLNRLEQDVFFGFSTSERDQYLLEPANAALFDEEQNPGKTMTWTEYANSPNYENSFYSYAATLAHNDIFSPHTSLNLNDSYLQQQLANLPLGANLNYLEQFLHTTLGVSTVETPTLSNPQEWFMGAYAYLQLAAENPMLFREKGLRLGAIISQGQNIANFCNSLTFNSGTMNINWTLWNVLENYYIASLHDFNSQISATETECANAIHFNLGAWRQWEVAAPRVTGTATTVLGPLDNPSSVTRIAAGRNFSLALKADGTAVGWGFDQHDETIVPVSLTNVVAIAAGRNHNIFLTATDTGGSTASGSLLFIRAELSDRVGPLIQSCNQRTLDELALSGSDLDNAARQLSGAKALLAAVLELGMPYTLAHDGVLQGFLYGSEPLVDTGTAIAFLQMQNKLLHTSPNTAPQPLTVEGALRYVRIQDRLNQSLTNLQATGQPEIPRLVRHTLRLLNLLNDAWTPPTDSPAPVLEMASSSNAPNLILYGEPYMNYTLQYQDSLGAPGWTTTTLTNLQDEQTILPPLSGGSQRFYRLMLPPP